VAYESQLKSDRAEWHRRLAAAIQEREPGTSRENAALIAEHLEPQATCPRPMAGTCAPPRGQPTAISALPGQLGAGAPDRRRAAADDPTTVDAHRAPHHAVRHRVASRGNAGPLRRSCGELVRAPGDKVSLADRMTGLVRVMCSGRSREASRLASEQMALLESIGRSHLDHGVGVHSVRQLVRVR
jgi:hypothetical protein